MQVQVASSTGHSLVLPLQSLAYYFTETAMSNINEALAKKTPIVVCKNIYEVACMHQIVSIMEIPVVTIADQEPRERYINDIRSQIRFINLLKNTIAVYDESAQHETTLTIETTGRY